MQIRNNSFKLINLQKMSNTSLIVIVSSLFILFSCQRKSLEIKNSNCVDGYALVILKGKTSPKNIAYTFKDKYDCQLVLSIEEEVHSAIYSFNHKIISTQDMVHKLHYEQFSQSARCITQVELDQFQKQQ